MNKFFGEIIRERRLEKGLTLRETAREIDCSPAFLCDIEKHRRYPKEVFFEELLELLDLKYQKEYLYLKILSETTTGVFKEIIITTMKDFGG
jgi:transcriptional regulator with XRE-family HTH domain